MSAITELDGWVIWLWPGLIKHWQMTSEIQPVIVAVEGCRVRLVGQWGRIVGVLMGDFATEEMAVEAGQRVSECLIFGYERTPEKAGTNIP